MPARGINNLFCNGVAPSFHATLMFSSDTSNGRIQPTVTKNDVTEESAAKTTETGESF